MRFLKNAVFILISALLGAVLYMIATSAGFGGIPLATIALAGGLVALIFL